MLNDHTDKLSSSSVSENFQVKIKARLRNVITTLKEYALKVALEEDIVTENEKENVQFDGNAVATKTNLTKNYIKAETYYTQGSNASYKKYTHSVDDYLCDGCKLGTSRPWHLKQYISTKHEGKQ